MRKTSKRTSPPYLIHSLNSLFHPTLILSIHPLTPISLLILPLFSPHSHPTISAYSLLSLLPYSLTAVSHPNVLSLNPVIVPHFLSRHSLSLFTLSPHTNFSTISLTQPSHPFLSLSFILLSHLSSSTPSLSLLSHPSFLPRFRNTLSSPSITILITPLSFHPSFSSLFLTPLYFSLHSFTPLSLSFTKKSYPLYQPSLAPRSPSVTQHTLIPLSSLSLSVFPFSFTPLLLSHPLVYSSHSYFPHTFSLLLLSIASLLPTLLPFHTFLPYSLIPFSLSPLSPDSLPYSLTLLPSYLTLSYSSYPSLFNPLSLTLILILFLSPISHNSFTPLFHIPLFHLSRTLHSLIFFLAPLSRPTPSPSLHPTF